MDASPQIAKALIVKAATVGALAGALLGATWLAVEIPWHEPRQHEVWPQWIGFLVLLIPATLAGTWIGGGVAATVAFLVQIGRGRRERALTQWTLGLLILWALITAIFAVKYNPYSNTAAVAAGDQTPRAVGRQLPDDKIPEMVAALDDPDPQVRCSAASSLFAVKSPALARDAVAKLLELTQDGSACARGAAIETLGRLAPQDEGVFAAARALLHDNDEDVKWRAANTLAACSCKRSVDIHFVADVLWSPGISMNVKTRLVRVAGCQNENGLSILERLLSSPDEHVQQGAIVETSRIIARDPRAPASASAFEALKNLDPVSDSVRRLRDSAVFRFETLRSRPPSPPDRPAGQPTGPARKGE